MRLPRFKVLSFDQLCWVDDAAAVEGVETCRAGIGGGAAEVLDEVLLGAKRCFSAHFSVFGEG